MLLRSALLLVLAVSCTVPVLTVGYRADDRCAPLYAACLNGSEFRQHYGLWLKPVKEREVYSLREGSRQLLTLRLEAQAGDYRVAERLAYGDILVGILSPEDVMCAVFDSFPVRIIAPLQSGGDMLVAGPAVEGDSWRDFVEWILLSDRQVLIGYVPRVPNGMLALEQALQLENAGDRVALLRLIDYSAVARDLEDGTLDAVVASNPIAWELAAATGSRIIGMVNDLPPGRFENSPSTVIAATDSAIAYQSGPVGSFLELMACATHYANNRTAATRAATAHWLQASPAEESATFTTYRFSSLPDWHFRTGLWNWYFALRVKGHVPPRLDGIMDAEAWYGVPYDSSLTWPALERAGRRIIR